MGKHTGQIHYPTPHSCKIVVLIVNRPLPHQPLLSSLESGDWSLVASALGKMVQFANWKFRKAGEEQWRDSHTTGSITEIFPDLIHYGDIPDPFVDQNERLVQWVGDTEWWYTSTLSVAPGQYELVLNGLDTHCDVYFNDEFVMPTDNMFTRYTKTVKAKGKNTVAIKFKPVTHIKKTFEPVTLLPEFGTDRLFVRKAQYHYGWDWGPTLMTCGIFKPVELISRQPLKVTVDYEVCECVLLKVSTDGEGEITHVLKYLDEVVWEGKGHSCEQKLLDVNLWYPFTHGNPHLYTLTSHRKLNGIIDSLTQSIGFRSAELIQDPLAKGESFHFRVNGTDVYINGCNWIPASPYLTTVTERDYREWLELMMRGNQNMIRVWGGGIYEHDDFYSTCDALGVLVWQDFLFACGQYPGDDSFTESVRLEALQNCQRLHPHACVVIYAGNNEDYQTKEEFSIPDDKFYAKHIYEEILPGVIKQVYGQNMAYIPGSPYTKNRPADDLTAGDVHQWSVWHGKELPYQDWSSLVGRFVSEFGMQAMPHYRTLQECITEKELYPQSSTVEYHNKAQGFLKKLSFYVNDNVRILNNDLISWIYATQLIQSEAMMYAIHAMRRQWNVPGARNCGGQLVWQINDTNPVTSWALCDYRKRPKMGYYSLKRSSEPLITGIERVGDSVHVYAVNLGAEVKADVQMKVWTVNSQLVESHEETIEIRPNSTTECFTRSVDPSSIVSVEINGSRYIDWPQPLKFYTVSAQQVDCYAVKGDSLVFTPSKLVKGVYIDCEGSLSDNGFDLVPGETKRVVVTSLTSSFLVLGTVLEH